MKDKFSKFSLPLLWFFATIVIIFMMTFTVNAQGLPYIVSNENIDNYDTFNNILINSKGLNMNNLPDYSFGYPIFEGGRRNFVLFIPNSTPAYEFTLTSADYQSFDIDSDRAQLHLITSYRRLQWHIENVQYGDSRFYGSDGSVSDVYINFFDGTSDGYGYELTPKYSMTNYIYDDNQYEVVFGFGNPTPPIDIGAAIIPPNPILPDYPNGTTAPTQVPPSFNPTDYTWTTPPTFDSSSVINAIQSVKDILEWLAGNLKEEFKNLTSNLKNFFDYIGQTIQYYGNAILETLNNFIQNFYDNISNVVSPIFDKVNYIAQPLDMVAINAAFTSTNFYGVKTQFTSVFTAFENAFDISEPNTFTLTINIQNIDTFYNFGCRSPVIIHLDEHFNPIKAALRTFLWILISFGSVFVVEKGLSNWLRGERNT